MNIRLFQVEKCDRAVTVVHHSLMG